MLAPALPLCYHSWICWPTAPEVDVQALYNSDRLLHPPLLPLSSHPPQSSNIKLLEVLNTHQGGSYLGVFLSLFLFPGPPGHRNHRGLSAFLKDSYSTSYPRSWGSPSSTWLDALWPCFHGSLIHILCHWQTYTIICLPHKLLSNLRPESALYSHRFSGPSMRSITKPLTLGVELNNRIVTYFLSVHSLQ